MKLIIMLFYPLKFIFDTINNRIKNIFNRGISRKDKVINDADLTIKSSWLTVSLAYEYITTTEKFKRFNGDVKIFFFSPNKLNKYQSTQRFFDCIFEIKHCYKRNYRDCDTS